MGTRGFRIWDKQEKRMILEPVMEGIFLSGNGNLVNPDKPMLSLMDRYIGMDSTGLPDKNGKEIYGGDIVKDKVNTCIWRYVIQPLLFAGTNLFAVCIWRNFTVIDGEIIMGDYPIENGNWTYISSTTEVIGNIYENPELLEAIDL